MIPTINTSLTPRKVNLFMSVSHYLMLLPFLAAALSYVYSDDSLCLYAHFQVANDALYFYYGNWLKRDAFIKLGILAICVLFARIRREIRHDDLFTPAQGNMLTLYWIFNIGWYTAGGVLFWQHVVNLPSSICNQSLVSFSYANLIATYIFIPIGLIISRLRPMPIQEALKQKTRRGDTEMGNI